MPVTEFCRTVTALCELGCKLIDFYMTEQGKRLIDEQLAARAEWRQTGTELKEGVAAFFKGELFQKQVP